jgi:O-antigen ligase/Tfp pilus assembly protein PilF
MIQPVRHYKAPSLPFLLGLGLVMLALALPFVSGWSTFIHMWRVELVASIFLATTLVYIYLRPPATGFQFVFSRGEVQWLIVPMTLLIVWSGASVAWALSWKSAIHHTFVWTEYLIFFYVFRHFMDSGSGYGRLVRVFAITLVLYSTPAIFEYCAYLIFGGGTTLGIRFAKYGEQIVTLFPLLLVGVLRMRGNRFVIGLVAITAMWLLIVCSFGRVNTVLFITAVVGLSALVYSAKRYSRYRFRLAAATAILLFAPFSLQFFSFFAPDVQTGSVVGRFTDSKAQAGSSDFRKLMVAVSSEMIQTHPIAGIGADNFGFQVNEYRAAYGTRNPDDVTLATAEDEIPGHAHNEFLQIVAELGLVGGAIVLWFLMGIAVLAYRGLRSVGSRSLYPAAAVLGLGMFLASSAVSAYSFRVMQNGIVFFFVLAVASKLLFKNETRDINAKSFSPTTVWRWRLAFACGLAACVGLAAYSSIRVASVMVTARANQTENLTDAMAYYDVAMRLDDENPDVRHHLAMRLFHEDRYAEAAPLLSEAIRIGRATSSDFSYLATCHTLTGNDDAAERTMAAAVALYPRSTFVLNRYAALLEHNGHSPKAQEVMDRANEIDPGAAKTWRTMITAGPKSVSDAAARDKSYLQVMELQPKSAVYAITSERIVRFPEERRWSLLGGPASSLR